ncbi:UNVERIFIED_CONTAM: hypothetical protein PYX00_009346 [Menopon gallinae]|uniref:Uncharacterized protein n=1 Tax=Menopon gallinae TaxID=328185 RepID=A0AAW2HAX4_9NEOP
MLLDPLVPHVHARGGGDRGVRRTCGTGPGGETSQLTHSINEPSYLFFGLDEQQPQPDTNPTFQLELESLQE